MGRFVVKNVNFFLVLMLMIVLGFSIGTSIYYEKRFGELSDDYVVTLNRMQEAEKYQGLYLEAIQSLNTTSQSIRFYDQLYENKSAELETTKTTMTSEISTLSSKLTSTAGELKRTQDSLDDKIERLDDAEDTVEELEETLENTQDDLEVMTTDYEETYDEREFYRERSGIYKAQRDFCEESYPGCYDTWDDED